MKQRQSIEHIAQGVFLCAGLITVGCVLLITVYLVLSGLPAIAQIGLVPFLFGRTWASTAANPSYGILPFILTSVYGTAGAIVIGVPVGFFTAVYLSKCAPKKVRSVLEAAVSLLAGIPSVVYGLVGMMVLVPFIRQAFHLPDGASLFAAMIVLAIMILPTVISVSASSLRAVPGQLRAASLALGASKIQTIFHVTVPAARSGILTGVVLGIGRALGEAMAINMVAGGSVNLPLPFHSVRFLTTQLVSEMSYAEGLHRQVLFTVGLVLYLFIIMVNLLLMRLKKKGAVNNG